MEKERPLFVILDRVFREDLPLPSERVYQRFGQLSFTKPTARMFLKEFTIAGYLEEIKRNNKRYYQKVKNY